MILVDTSVLVYYLRSGNLGIRAVLADAPCAICGVIRAEVLHGARTQQDAVSLRIALDSFTQLPIPQTVWDELGSNLSVLRSRGLPMPFQDVLIATVALHHDAELWTLDGHFAAMQVALPSLKLFVGPSTR